jgi:aminoglycoside 3-N-acetyltransferase
MNQNKGLTRQALRQDFEKLGIKKGDTLLVHSSLSSLGFVEGGANTVIDALLDAVGKEGNVMVPTLTGSETFSPANPPVFDVRNTPCWTGKIPETFRNRPDAVRSLHPTHSVAAIGPQAKFLTEGHENALTPCGQNTPYVKLTQLGGYVLFLGAKFHSCTLLHGVEELADLPYHMQKDFVQALITDQEGNQLTRKLKIHFYGPGRDFEKLLPILEKHHIITTGTVGQATTLLIKAKELLELALQEVKKDPEFLLKR